MSKLLYQGHGSYRVTTNGNFVIYIDPYAGDGYDIPADLILVTHGHHDHNQTGLVSRKPDCRIITHVEALAGGKHNTFDVGVVIIEAVTAENIKHNPNECVGYILAFDGITVYCSGDTSKTEQMSSFAKRKLDYALFPLDGIYNMDLEEGAECARIVGAKHNVPIHIKPGELFDADRARMWNAPDKLVVLPGETIELK